MNDDTYNTAQIVLLTGLSDRQVDHNARKQNLQRRRGQGSGNHRRWSTSDVWKWAVLADLLAQTKLTDFWPQVWKHLDDARVKPGDARWLSVNAATGEVRTHKTPRGAGVLWVSLRDVIDPVERERARLFG